eukprot:5079258-Pleurochrysis_carterae.AAC.1
MAREGIAPRALVRTGVAHLRVAGSRRCCRSLRTRCTEPRPRSCACSTGFLARPAVEKVTRKLSDFEINNEH